MSEAQRKRGRPPGKELPERLVVPCTLELKRQVTAAAEAAAWVRQAIQDRLDHQIRVRFGDKEDVHPLNYNY